MRPTTSTTSPSSSRRGDDDPERAVGGLAAGFVAALVVRFVADAPSPPTLSDRAVGSSSPSARWIRAAVRILYGGAAGGALVALELLVLGVLAVPPSAGAALGLALSWSALLFALLAVVRRTASSGSVERSLRAPLVFHTVYGIGLGLWVRATWIT